MSTYPVTPRSMPRKRGFGGILILLCILAVVIYFLYNMMPNLFSAILPNKDTVGGEWVGLVKYQKDTMGGLEQPAALKLTMAPTNMTSVVPTYKLTGELRVAGHTTPITFQAGQIITGHSIKSLGGFLDQSSDDGLKSAGLNGTFKDGRLQNFDMTGMGGGTSSTVKGSLQKGTDADFANLVKQIQ